MHRGARARSFLSPPVGRRRHPLATMMTLLYFFFLHNIIRASRTGILERKTIAIYVYYGQDVGQKVILSRSGGPGRDERDTTGAHFHTPPCRVYNIM